MRKTSWISASMMIASSVVLLGAPSFAHADPAPLDDATRSAARTLINDGIALYDKKDYPAAYDKLRKADELVQLPTTGLMVARALDKLGRLVEASEKYLAVAQIELAKNAKEAQTTAKTNAEAERTALLPRIPNLQITLDATLAGAEVKLDGKPVPSVLIGEKRPVDPGKHTVEATRGAEHVAVDVVLVEASTATVPLHGIGAPPPIAATPLPVATPSTPTSAPAPAPSSPLRTAGWITAGVGGAAVAVGIVTGLKAVSSEKDLESAGCKGGLCPPSAQDQLDSHNLARALSMGTLYGGAALTAAGLACVLFAPNPRDATTGVRVVPWMTAQSAGFRGEF